MVAFGVGEVDLRRQLEGAFRLEPAAQVLDDEDVAVVRQLLEGGGELGRRLVGYAVRRAAEQDRQRSRLLSRTHDGSLQMNPIAHGDHDLFQRELGS